MSRREQLASEAGGELDPKLAGAQDPHNGMLVFSIQVDYRKQHLVLKKGPPHVN